MAQLQKQARKAKNNGERTHIVALKNFNPVMKPGLEITIATTLHNIEGVTHVVVTSRRRPE